MLLRCDFLQHRILVFIGIQTFEVFFIEGKYLFAIDIEDPGIRLDKGPGIYRLRKQFKPLFFNSFKV